MQDALGLRRRFALLALLAAAVQPAAAQPAQGVPVSVAQAVRQDVQIITTGIGTVQALQTVLVRARVDGTVEQLGFKEGQDVQPGDLIAVIDPRPYQAILDQAVAKRAADTAMLANNKRDLARYTDLARSDFASRQSVDTQSATVSQAAATIQADDAAIAAAKLNLDFTRIAAPIAGRVGFRLVDVGNLIHATDTTGIVTINQIHPISVLFTLPQREFPLVQDAIRAKGSTALPTTATTSDSGRALAHGALASLNNSIDTSTGTITLKAQFGNLDNRLWPGQFVNIRLQLSIAKDAVTVPSAAIQHGVNGLYVYAVKNDATAALVAVQTGQDEDGTTIVTTGLSGGESVVTSGQSRLTDGAKVTIRPGAAPVAGG